MGPGRWIARKSLPMNEGPEYELRPDGRDPTEGPDDCSLCEGWRLWLAIDIGLE